MNRVACVQQPVQQSCIDGCVIMKHPLCFRPSHLHTAVAQSNPVQYAVQNLTFSTSWTKKVGRGETHGFSRQHAHKRYRCNLRTHSVPKQNVQYHRLWPRGCLRNATHVVGSIALGCLRMLNYLCTYDATL